MRRSFTVLCAAVTLLAAAGSLYGAGQREDPIHQAEELISERRYSEAIEILQEVGRTDPDRFDQAERLLRRIRETRSHYNELWQDLIRTLREEPDNVDHAYSLIEQMEAIDDAPTEEALREFERWRDIVTLRFNLNRFERISSEAIELIGAQEYAEAIRVYLGGLEIFREEFEESGYEGTLIADALEAQNRLRAIGEITGARHEELDRAVADFVERFEERLIDDESFESLFSVFDDVAEIEFRTAGIGHLFRMLDSQAQEEREFQDPDPFLTFQRWIAYGRSAQAGNEGIFAAARLFVEDRFDRLLERTNTITTTPFSEAEQLLDRDDYGDAIDPLTLSEQMLVDIERLFDIIDRRQQMKEEFAESAERAQVPTREIQELRFSDARAAVRALRDMTDERERLASVLNDSDDIAELKSVWQSLYTSLSAGNEALAHFEETSREPTGADEVEIEYVARVEPYLLSMHETIASREREAANRYLAQLNEQSAPELSYLEDEVEAAVRIGIEGVAYSDPSALPEYPGVPEEDELTYRYPGIAQQRLTDREAEIVNLVERLASAQSDFEEPAQPISEEDELAEHLRRLEELRERAERLLDDSRTALGDLDQRLAESEILRTEVRDRLSEAESILADDPMQAADLFDDAEDLLVDTLELEQDPDFRNEIDALFADLGSRIRDAQFQITIGDVRELINEGRSLYRQDAFSEAESVLVEARERWQRINDTENSEIRYWLRLTQSALNLQTDRELSDSDPLYRALGNYLSLAYDAFSRAQSASSAGDSDEAEQLLARAENNIQSVTVARPFNEDARVLGLRIVQLANPDEFEQIFQQRLDQAVAMANEEPMEALNDLYDLEAVNPDWPGLEQAIVDVEIAAGVREPPREDTSVDEANSLYAQAQSAFNEGNSELAESLLEEAIELDPDNSDARSLLDDVRLSVGTTASPTLSSTDLQQFRRAENHFIDGQIGRALLIVERLWQDEDNRRYGPLSDLRSRMVSQ